MIATQILKYKIFEWCLDALVDKLIINFRTNPNGLTKVPWRELREGMYIKEIWFIIQSRGFTSIMKGCRIEEIKYWDSERTKIKEIYFTWLSYRNNTIDKIQYPSSNEVGTLCDIQSVEWNINGINNLGLIPEFYV